MIAVLNSFGLLADAVCWLAAGESLGEALDRAFAERIKLPQGDTIHAGAPIQDTRAAPLPLPFTPPDKAKPSGGHSQTLLQQVGRQSLLV